MTDHLPSKGTTKKRDIPPRPTPPPDRYVRDGGGCGAAGGVCAMLALLFFIAMLLAGCDGPPKVDGMDTSFGDVDVWIDPGTGCQYLVDGRGSYRGGIIQRMRADGAQICASVETKL